MRKLIAVILGGLAIGLGALNVAPAAAAGPTYCSGLMKDTEVWGDLYVASDATCILSNVAIHGNLKTQPGSDLQAESVLVEKDLHAAAAKGLHLARTKVNGNATVQGSVPVPTKQFVMATIVVDGNFQYVSGVAEMLFTYHTTDNKIGGNLTFTNNKNLGINDTQVAGSTSLTGNKGEVYIQTSTLLGPVNCWANTQTPQGAQNVAPQKYGQCANI